jgi:hypothetical protein
LQGDGDVMSRRYSYLTPSLFRIFLAEVWLEAAGAATRGRARGAQKSENATMFNGMFTLNANVRGQISLFRDFRPDRNV